MNTLKALRMLQDATKNIQCASELVEDFRKYVFKSGYEKQVFGLLIKNLQVLNKLGKEAIKTNNFEKLKGCNDLYSMHLHSAEFNLRILYSYLDNGEILLHCFAEKQGKRVTEYERHIQIANERLKNIRSDDL